MAAATITTIAIGAAIGAGVGAVGTYAAGGRGDALWKGALTGAVAGAVTAGVGSWAGGAAATGGLGWGATAAGALAGGAGGVTAGALGTALSGGTGKDYLKNMFVGGATGTALGAAGGYLQGGEQVRTPESMGIDASNANYQEALGVVPPDTGATGVNVGTSTAPAVEQSITGAPAAAQGPTTTPLDMTVASIADAPTVPIQDVSSPTLANAVSTTGSTAPTTEFAPFGGDTAVKSATPSLGETSFTFDDYPSQAMIDKGTANPMGTQDAANSWSFKAKELGSDLGFDTFGYGKNATTATAGQGKGMNDLMKAMGYSQLMRGGVNTLGAAATYNQTKQDRANLMDIYNDQNAYNQLYAGKLQQSFDDPNAYLNSPEAAASRTTAMQKLLAQNAAAGRRTAGLALQNPLLATQLQNLAAYRRSIPQPNYVNASSIYNTGAAYNPNADLVGGLSSMVTPLSLYSLYA